MIVSPGVDHLAELGVGVEPDPATGAVEPADSRPPGLALGAETRGDRARDRLGRRTRAFPADPRLQRGRRLEGQDRARSRCDAIGLAGRAHRRALDLADPAEIDA